MHSGVGEIKVGDKVRIGRGAEMVEVIAVHGVLVHYESRMWTGSPKHGYWFTHRHATLKSNITEVVARA